MRDRLAALAKAWATRESGDVYLRQIPGILDRKTGKALEYRISKGDGVTE